MGPPVTSDDCAAHGFQSQGSIVACARLSLAHIDPQSRIWLSGPEKMCCVISDIIVKTLNAYRVQSIKQYILLVELTFCCLLYGLRNQRMVTIQNRYL